MRSGVIDTLFADPPFNIGKDYRNGYKDKVSQVEYTLLISIFRFFIQPMSSKLFVSKERNSR
ncbi:MAG: hypothetical protein [Olavius algarvensis Gamma 1 endosymbiont]|nr:MAG: hypothetical protein [Olavius algarvensis Gamma 1 endosymbiont]